MIIGEARGVSAKSPQPPSTKGGHGGILTWDVERIFGRSLRDSVKRRIVSQQHHTRNMPRAEGLDRLGQARRAEQQ
jgi:hypothetical protein